MQLIEIVQIVLLIFIAVSAIIFFFSYLGYKSKSKILELPKTPTKRKTEAVNETNVVKKLPENTKKVEQYKLVKPQEKTKLTPRFEVFTPTPDENSKLGSGKSNKKKSHTPKTLIIKHKS